MFYINKYMFFSISIIALQIPRGSSSEVVGKAKLASSLFLAFLPNFCHRDRDTFCGNPPVYMIFNQVSVDLM